MRKVQVYKYLFTAKEIETINNYINWLSRHPLPCTTCPAQKWKKCNGYDIFSQSCNREETCQQICDWFNDGETHRSLFRQLKDDEVKEMIRNRYFLELTKQVQAKTNSELLLAENKVKTDNEKLGQDFAIDPRADIELFEDYDEYLEKDNE